MSAIDLDPERDEDRALWHAVGELTALLPDDWTLVGGLMVQLHAIESGVRETRATTDVDVLGQARPQGTLSAIDQALIEAGFWPHDPDLDGYAFRYERDGLVVDVLAPEGIKPPPRLDRARMAVGIPGGSQALARTERVLLRIDGREFELRRPTLLGAILIKARSLMRHRDPESQREDLLVLLSLVGVPRDLAAEMRKTERQWLRTARERLRFDEPAVVSASTVRRAEQAYRVLVGGPD
jgi:hypothetical protein